MSRSLRIDLDRNRLLGFDHLTATADGRLADPRAAMVGVPKDDGDDPDDDESVGGIQTLVARALADPGRAEHLCAALAGRLGEVAASVDRVVAPAVGGVVPGFEVARVLGVPFACLDSTEEGFVVRRGSEIPAGARCVVVDDTVARGLAMEAALHAVREAGGEVVAAGCLVKDPRSEAEFGVPLVWLEEDAAALEERVAKRAAA